MAIHVKAQHPERKDSSEGSDIFRLLKEINEESAQISELRALEEKYVQDLSEVLKGFLKSVGTSVDLSKEAIKSLGMKASKVSITPECEIRIVLPSSHVKVAKLQDMSPELAASILTAALPGLKEVLIAYRAKRSERASFLEGIIKGLKDLLTSSSIPQTR